MGREFYTEGGWSGKYYDSGRSTKDTAKSIRETLRLEYRDCKFGVTTESFSGGSSINVYLMEASFEVFNPVGRERAKGYHQVNHYHLNSDTLLTKEAKKVLAGVIEISNRYRRDDSDGRIDYFSTNFYFHVSVGKWNKPFVVVDRKSRGKARR